MGIYDTIHAYVSCPFCKAKNEVHCQTKDFYSWFYKYEIGDRLKGGPYLDGDYGPAEKTCSECGRTFFCLWSVKDNFLSDINTYSEEDLNKFSDSSLFSFINPEPYNSEIIIDKIKLASIELLKNISNDELKEIMKLVNWNGALYVDGTTHPANEISRVLNYLIMLFRISEDFIGDCKKIINQLKIEYIEEYYDDFVKENEFEEPLIRLNRIQETLDNELKYIGQFILDSACKIEKRIKK